jgi:hypothetical protein
MLSRSKNTRAIYIGALFGLTSLHRNTDDSVWDGIHLYEADREQKRTVSLIDCS